MGLKREAEALLRKNNAQIYVLYKVFTKKKP